MHLAVLVLGALLALPTAPLDTASEVDKYEDIKRIVRVLVPISEQRRRENAAAANAYLAELHSELIDDTMPLRYEPPVLVGLPDREPNIHKPVRCNSIPRRTSYNRWGR